MSSSGGFVGADLEAAQELIAALEKAGPALSEGATQLRRILGSVGLPAGSASTVAEMGSWAAGQATDVRRHLNELEQAGKGSADSLSGLPPWLAAILGPAAGAGAPDGVSAYPGLGGPLPDSGLGPQDIKQIPGQLWDVWGHHFLPGLWEGTRDLGLKALASNPMTAPGMALTDFQRWKEYGPIGEAKGIAHSVMHPLDFVKGATDWDTLKTDPFRWLGRLTPDIALLIATKGTSAAARGAERGSAGAERASEAASKAGRLRRAVQSGAGRPDPAALSRAIAEASRNAVRSFAEKTKAVSESANKVADSFRRFRAGPPSREAPRSPGQEPRPEAPKFTAPGDKLVAGPRKGEPTTPKDAPKPSPRRVPGEDFGEKLGKEIKHEKGRLAKITDRINTAGFDQETAANAADAAARAAFGETSGSVRLADGTRAVIPKHPNVKDVFIVGKDGHVSTRKADVIIDPSAPDGVRLKFLDK